MCSQATRGDLKIVSLHNVGMLISLHTIMLAQQFLSREAATAHLFVLSFKPYSTLLIVSYCTLHRKYSLCAVVHRFCVSRKGGTGEGRCSHPQSAVHMAAARLGCKMTMVDTKWANY